jgi:hypothetical protein
MSEAKHTAGPWEAKRETDYVSAQIWADGRQLAEVYGESRAVTAMNARLIAAAPELLNELKSSLEFLRDAALFLTEIGATREMQPQRVARLIEKTEAAIRTAE